MPQRSILSRFFLPALSCMLLSSCFVNRYQKVYTKWEKSEASNPSFTSKDSLIKTTYSLWSKNGNLDIRIDNLTDTTIFIQPLYTIEIINGQDTSYLDNPGIIYVKDQSGKESMNFAKMSQIVYDGYDIPIPAHGWMEIQSLCVGCRMGLDYSPENPARGRDSVTYEKSNSPFQYESRIAYSLTSDSMLRVVRHSGYISKIDRFRRIGNIEDVDEKAKKEESAFYIHSQRPSALMWIGTFALGAWFIIMDLDQEAHQ